jgi:arylsulfatase
MFGGFTVEAEIEDGEHGMVCAFGDLHDGFALYLLDGCPVATFVSGGQTTRLAAETPVPSGVCSVSLSAGGGQLTLAVDGETAGTAAHRGMLMFPAVGTAAGGLLVGRDRGLAVSDDYEPPFPFSGTLRRITFSSRRPDRKRPADAEIKRAQAAD